MPHFYDTFPEHLQHWALNQSIFFTASAPINGRHINLSPKGVPSRTFGIFDQNHAAYVDLTGSGAETISHIYENGRVTVMFCSFGKNPRILRLFCKGRVIESDQSGFAETIAAMGLQIVPGARAVVLLDIWKVQTSCGYGVPFFDDREHQSHTIENANAQIGEDRQLDAIPCKCFEDRHALEQWLVNKVNKKALDDYQTKLNSRSLDGLLGLRMARKMRGEWLLAEDIVAYFLQKLYHPEALILGVILGLLLAAFSPIFERVFFQCFVLLKSMEVMKSR